MYRASSSAKLAVQGPGCGYVNALSRAECGKEPETVASWLELDQHRGMTDIVPFSDLAKRYDVIFFDAFGVLKKAGGVIPGVLDVLAWLTRSQASVFVLTNDASRSPRALGEAYTHEQHGPLVPESHVISSGLLAKDFLRGRFRSGRVAYLGKPASAFYIEAAGLEPVPISECESLSDVRALVLLDDEGFDWFRDVNRVVNLLRTANVPVVVANPDLSYPVGGDEVALAVGSLAGMIQNVIKRTFIRFGKPDSMMFSHAFACAHELREHLTKDRVLMVGDTLHTDILGANTFGIDSALVLSGVTRREQAALEIAATGIIPTYVCESILT